MCYHVQTPAKKELEHLSVFEEDYKIIDEYEGYYHNNGFDHNDVPVITSEEPGAIQFFRWGLIPGWVNNIEKALEMQNFTLNATCENVFEKPSFKGSIYKKRCLVIVKGFFENRHEGKKKYPYFIFPANQPFFFLGGIYSEWADKTTGELLHTCSIITTPANSLMTTIHNSKMRMPLIIPNKKKALWLNPALKQEEITALMVPYNDAEMNAHTVAPLVNQYRLSDTNVPEVSLPVAYPELE